MSSVASHPDEVVEQEKGLAGFAQKLARWTEKWFPDAFIFALIGVAVVAIACFINMSKPGDVFLAVGSGFWDLGPFSLQMAMVVLTGYVVATSRPVGHLIEWLARIPRSPRTAIAFVAFVSMLVSYLSWGMSLVFGGLLARAVARRRDIRVDYRALGAASFMGLGAVWALGISSSAAQYQANKGSMTADILKITGVLPYTKTIWTWQSLVMIAILWIVVVLVALFTAPKESASVTAEMMGVDLDDTVEAPVRDKDSRPGEWFEFSPILPAILGLLVLGWVIAYFIHNQRTVGAWLTIVNQISNLNFYLMLFLVLGLVLHKTPRAFMTAVVKAIPATAGVLVQFPLYAVMAKLLTTVPGHNGHTLSHLLSNIFTGVGVHGFPLLLSLYTIVLGILVPSGGGKWQVEAPYVMDAANHLHYNLGWTVQIYNVSEALPNLVNPFFMLPLLSILKVRARDLVGYTFVQFLFNAPLVLLLVWLLGMTFGYEPPVIPK